MQVSLSDQFQMPPDCELFSAVYWVYSPHKLNKPSLLRYSTVLYSPCSDKQCAQFAVVSTKCTSHKELLYMFRL